MKILVTGSNGFLGTTFGRFAASAGNEVFGISRENTARPEWPGDYIAADLAADDITDTIASIRPELIFHGAGTASVGASFDEPVSDFSTAVLTWIRVLDAVRTAAAYPIVIFPSSAAIYGNELTTPVDELAPLNPISPYGYHKLVCETVAREYAVCFGLNIIICRLFSLFGPLQRRLLVYELFERSASDDAVVTLEGTGLETRDYLYADDAVAAMLRLAADHGPSGSALTLNLGSGTECNVADLAAEIASLQAVNKQVVCRGVPRPGDPPRMCADITRLRGFLPDWRPRSLSDGLAKAMAGWRASAAPEDAHKTKRL